MEIVAISSEMPAQCVCVCVCVDWNTVAARRWVSVAGQLRVPRWTARQCTWSVSSLTLRLQDRLWDSPLGLLDVRHLWRCRNYLKDFIFLSLSLFPLLFLDLCLGPRPTTLPFVIIFPFDLFLLRLSLRFHFSLNMAHEIVGKRKSDRNRIENCICSVAYWTIVVWYLSKSFRVVAAIYWHVYATFGSCV